MQIEAAAWKNLVNDQHIYMMQFCTGSTKEAKTIVDTLKDWHQTGTGYNKEGQEVMVFRKTFKDTPSWIEWAKTAPFIINEVDKEGSTKKRVKTIVALPDDGKRKCRLCNKSGHNAQTCDKNPKKALVKKFFKVAGKKICGHCGEVGHNKRTCSKLKNPHEK